MTKEQDEPSTRQQARQGWFWSRGSGSLSQDESSAASTSTPPQSPSSLPSKHTTPPPSDPRLDMTRQPPTDLPKLEGNKLDPANFQSNFPQGHQNGPEAPTVTDAFKTIKPEDFLEVTQKPCARNGFVAGIITGGLVGGLKFMMRTPIPKVANWAVGGTIAGAAASFEYCHYQRRREKLRMRRAVEVYQEEMADKRRREYQERASVKDEADAKSAEEAMKKPWWKVW